MRRLAGSLLYFIAALIVIYSASWMLLGFKEQAQGHTIKITHKGVFGVRIKITLTPSPTPASNAAKATPTGIPSPSLTSTPTPTPTPSAKQNSIPEPSPTPTKGESRSDLNTSSNQGPTLNPQASIPQQPTVTIQSSTSGGDGSILDGINNFRVSKGLSRATSNPETCAFAKTRAGEISSAFNHDGFNQRISGKTLPYSSYSIVTENIAENSDPTQIVNMWINSAPHAENMQKDTPFICVVRNGNYFAYEGWKP